MKNKRVSIVIIGRNEERGIEKCLRAASDAAQQIGGAEIIFVDSASTDDTVSIVQSFGGVRVLSLKPDWKLTPSAGRYVGSQYARGEFILFIDADTLAYRDFLPRAIEHFEQNPEVGGINGRIDDMNESGEILADVEDRYDEVANVKWLRGPCCFYRKAALEKAGSFNPHLAVEEEAELGLRLIKNGWKLHLIPVSMACHTRFYHMQTLESVISTCRRDIVAKRFGEITKTMAYSFKEGYGLVFCWLRLKTTIVFLGWIFLLFLCLFLPEFLYPKTICLSLAVLGTLAIVSKKRSLKQAILFMLSKIFNFVDVLGGLHKIDIKNPVFYPLDVVEHKQTPIQIKERNLA